MENDKIFELLSKMHGEMNTRFDLMEKDIKDVKQDLSSVKEDVGSLKEDVTTLKEDVTSFKEDVNFLKQDVITLKQDLSDVKEDVNFLKEDMSTVKIDINKIYAKIDGDIYDKLKNLGDGYTANFDISTEIRKNVKENSINLDHLNMAVAEIRDDVNYIASKVIKQDGRLNRLDNEIIKRAVT